MSDCEAALATAARRLGVPYATLWLRDADGTAVAHYPSPGRAKPGDERFTLGCLIKPVTATLVMQLVESGAISLDAPITRFFPELSCPHDAAAITVRDLLRHTSGLDCFELEERRASQPPRAARGRLPRDVPESLTTYFPAGRYFSYGNTNYLLLADLLEQWHDMPFADIVRERIFEPLGLRPTSNGRSPSLECVRGAYSAVQVSGPDLLTLFASHARLGDDAVVLSAGGIRTMQTRHVAVWASNAHHDGWGLGWALYGDRVFGHDTRSEDAVVVRAVPEARSLLVLRAAGGRVLDLAAVVVNKIFGIPPPSSLPISASDLDARSCIGTYRSHHWELQIDQDGDDLRGDGVWRPFLSRERFRFTLSQLSRCAFIMSIDGGRARMLVTFLPGHDAARSAMLWDGQRLTAKVGCRYL